MKLNYKKIVSKKFETVINGYSPTQVDIYLDQICSDYIEYSESISTLSLEVEVLKKENAILKKNLKTKEKELNAKSKNANNLVKSQDKAIKTTKSK